jgi:hypothetical protein
VKDPAEIEQQRHAKSSTKTQVVARKMNPPQWQRSLGVVSTEKEH